MDWTRSTGSNVLRLNFTCIEGSNKVCQSFIQSIIRHIHVVSPKKHKSRRLDINASQEHNDLVPMANGWTDLYSPTM